MIYTLIFATCLKLCQSVNVMYLQKVSIKADLGLKFLLYPSL